MEEFKNFNELFPITRSFAVKSKPFEFEPFPDLDFPDMIETPIPPWEDIVPIKMPLAPGLTLRFSTVYRNCVIFIYSGNVPRLIRLDLLNLTLSKSETVLIELPVSVTFSDNTFWNIPDGRFDKHKGRGNVIYIPFMASDSSPSFYLLKFNVATYQYDFVEVERTPNVIPVSQRIDRYYIIFRERAAISASINFIIFNYQTESSHKLEIQMTHSDSTALGVNALSSGGRFHVFGTTSVYIPPTLAQNTWYFGVGVVEYESSGTVELTSNLPTVDGSYAISYPIISETDGGNIIATITHRAYFFFTLTVGGTLSYFINPDTDEVPTSASSGSIHVTNVISGLPVHLLRGRDWWSSASGFTILINISSLPITGLTAHDEAYTVQPSQFVLYPMRDTIGGVGADVISEIKDRVFNFGTSLITTANIQSRSFKSRDISNFDSIRYIGNIGTRLVYETSGTPRGIILIPISVIR